MAPRIEKIWGTIFGQSGVKRKETKDRDPSQGQGYDQGGANQNGDGNSPQNPDNSDQEQKLVFDRPMLEKAAEELRALPSFSQTGMKLDIIETKTGIVVRLLHGSGNLIKEMGAEEFLKLKDSSSGQSVSRGKFLDQKF